MIPSDGWLDSYGVLVSVVPPKAGRGAVVGRVASRSRCVSIASRAEAATSVPRS